MIGWTPPDGEGRTPTPGDQARRAAFMLFVLVGALGTVLGVARDDSRLLWVGVPCLVVAAVLLLAPIVLDRRR